MNAPAGELRKSAADIRRSAVMKKTVRIPIGGMPPWRPEAEPDSRLHALLRTVMYCMICLLYGGLMVLHFLQIIHISMHGMTVLAVTLVLSIPVVEYLIRPGKGKVWLITFFLIPFLVFMPLLVLLLMILLPIVLLVTQGITSCRKKKATSTISSEAYMDHKTDRGVVPSE